MFGAGALTPIAITALWFLAYGAIAHLWTYAVVINARLNGDRLSPFPRLLSNVIQQPALYVLGVAGLVQTLRSGAAIQARAAASIDSRPLTYTALSLVAGIFVIGRAYDQYYALLLPLFAMLGGSFVGAMIAAAPPRRTTTGVVALLVVTAALATANEIRAFKPIALQTSEIEWVLQRTQPTDSYLGGSPGPALFRPSAWYFFFLTGPFASDADYADMTAALRSGRLRPRLVVMDDYLRQRAPQAALAYIRSHYRQVGADLYMRQKENGRSTLNTSDASERFDRPLTR
jgi:hypothetical protein